MPITTSVTRCSTVRDSIFFQDGGSRLRMHRITRARSFRRVYAVAAPKRRQSCLFFHKERNLCPCVRKVLIEGQSLVDIACTSNPTHEG